MQDGEDDGYLLDEDHDAHLQAAGERRLADVLGVERAASGDVIPFTPPAERRSAP